MCVIIAASSMREAGHVPRHLKYPIGDPRTTVSFVGNRVENALDRKIQDGHEVMKIFGTCITIIRYYLNRRRNWLTGRSQ